MAARGDDMKQDEKDKFTDMEPADRDAHMARHPVPEDTEKTVAAAVAKALASNPEVVALRKRAADLEAVNALVTFTKQAADLGIGDAHGVTLQKAYAGDKASIDTLAGLLKAANMQAKEAGIFKEFGSGSGNLDVGSSAHDQMLAKAAELRKADPKLTEAQAYAKAYSDPANVALAKRERAENRPA